MDFSVYLPLFLAIGLAAVAPQIARSLPPRTGVWVLSVAAATVAVGWIVSLAMIAFTGLGRMPLVAHEGHWSASRWRHDDPVGVWTATIAGLVLVACLLRFMLDAAREIAARHLVRRISRGFGSGDMVVFVDDEAPHAYAVGGRHPRIVISRGLLRTLTSAERRAVLEHETAHVRHRHHLHLLVIRLAAAVNPLLRPALPVAVLAVERWADEATAATIGDRTLVARALLRAALAGAERRDLPHGVLAHHGAGDVGERVHALMQEPPRPRLSMTLATSALLVATIVAPAIAASNLDSLFDQASAQPAHTVGSHAVIHAPRRP
jgi:Zn-dependent protease with chaperone function